jgi:hypothetical protein
MKHLTSVAAKLTILCCLAATLPAMAADISLVKQATVTRMIGKKIVTIDGKQVIIGKNNVARRGQVISAAPGSGTEIDFGSHGKGNLVGGAAIKIGSRCFVLDKGSILIDGKVSGCMGRSMAGSKN